MSFDGAGREVRRGRERLPSVVDLMLRGMEARVYDWNHPTGAEVEIERKLAHGTLPLTSLERLEEVRSSIAQMRLDCKRLAMFAA